MMINTWLRRCSFVWGNPAKASELPWRVLVLSGLKTAATVTCDSVIRTKDNGYRSVKNGAILSVVEPHCSDTRHSGSVTHTAEDD